jgi:hypothetical protein
VAATVVTCLLVTMVGWAALIGPSKVFTGPGSRPSSETTKTTTSPPPIDGVKELERKGHREARVRRPTIIIANLIGGAIQLFVLVGMGWVAYLLLRRARRAWQLRRHVEAAATVCLHLEPVPARHDGVARLSILQQRELRL